MNAWRLIWLWSGNENFIISHPNLLQFKLDFIQYFGHSRAHRHIF